MQAIMILPFHKKSNSIKLKPSGNAWFGLLLPPIYYGGSAMVVVFHR
jgi:hypothetical protein